jgi:hypothetical protein
MVVFTKIEITRQPWTGTPERPEFLTPIYRVEFDEGRRKNALEFPATDAIEARQIASRELGIPFVMN